MWAWGQAGVSLPHYSRAQYASLPHVPLDQLQPGDLVFIGNPIHHVGMYIGNGQMVDAASPRLGILRLADPRPRRRRPAGLMAAPSASLSARSAAAADRRTGKYVLRPCCDGASGAITPCRPRRLHRWCGRCRSDDDRAPTTTGSDHHGRPPLPPTTMATTTTAPPHVRCRAAYVGDSVGWGTLRNGLAAALAAVGCPLVWSSARPGHGDRRRRRRRPQGRHRRLDRARSRRSATSARPPTSSRASS